MSSHSPAPTMSVYSRMLWMEINTLKGKLKMLPESQPLQWLDHAQADWRAASNFLTGMDYVWCCSTSLTRALVEVSCGINETVYPLEYLLLGMNQDPFRITALWLFALCIHPRGVCEGHTNICGCFWLGRGILQRHKRNPRIMHGLSIAFIARKWVDFRHLWHKQCLTICFCL